MTSKNDLALFGGKKVITSPFKDFSTIDESDEHVAMKVLKSKRLSQYIGDKGQFFLGGKEVRNLENKFARFFQVESAISVNSWTSGLWAAIGALGLEPGSEVITSPWTMAATATTILHWNLVPVFSDIDPNTFNLDIGSVESNISSNTRAIVSPDIFGQSANIELLIKLCQKYDLKLISDTAQSPMATRNGYFAGTKADIGGFSFNYHKHIQSGEGGMIVTNNSEYAERLQLLRNHGEVYLSRLPKSKWKYGILGMNMRLGEIESAIAANQLDKLETSVNSRRQSAEAFTKGLMNLDGLRTPVVEQGNDHVYYVFGLDLDVDLLGVKREKIVRALESEGVMALEIGYQNLHLLPLFREQLTYKGNALPYSLISRKRANFLKRQSLPIAESLHKKSFFGIGWCVFEYSQTEVQLLVEAFQKVWSNLDHLRSE